MPKTTTIQSETFCRAIEAVHRCASKEIERPHLNAILLEVNDQEVRAVTTNGHLVADYREDYCGEDNRKAKYLFNLDGAIDAARTVKKFGKRWPHTPGGPTITLKAGKRQIVLSFEEETIIGISTVDEDFPPIEKVIPKVGREPKFKHNFVAINAGLVVKVMQCFTAIGKSRDFQAWDFGGELDPICVFKRYKDYSATLVVVIMPARVDAGDGRAGKEAP